MDKISQPGFITGLSTGIAVAAAGAAIYSALKSSDRANASATISAKQSCKDDKDAVVILDYEELLPPTTSPELMAKIEKAYGYGGYGLLAVRGAPHFKQIREECLPFAYKFGNLPEETKKKYEHEKSFFSFGWSHGKEKLEGKADTAKGSYYYNPVHDKPVDDPSIIDKYAPFAHPNIWPLAEDCPGFEQAMKMTARKLVEVGSLLSRHVDNYVASKLPSFRSGEKGQEYRLLHNVIEQNRCHKARMLYYFPVPEGTVSSSNADDVSGWCGWHNDHGSLTGLCPAMFFDKDGKVIPCPDPRAGLYIKARDGRTIRVSVPADHIAFQIGETAQIHSGGILQATPHCVRPAEVAGVSRATVAVFMEPEWHVKMDIPKKAERENVLRGAKGELLPKGVPPLVGRWSNDMDFGQFTEKTLGSYY